MLFGVVHTLLMKVREKTTLDYYQAKCVYIKE